jgi:hypothetical protein
VSVPVPVRRSADTHARCRPSVPPELKRDYPEYAQLMVECWDQLPQNRPSFYSATHPSVSRPQKKKTRFLAVNISGESLGLTLCRRRRSPRGCIASFPRSRQTTGRTCSSPSRTNSNRALRFAARRRTCLPFHIWNVSDLSRRWADPTFFYFIFSSST